MHFPMFVPVWFKYHRGNKGLLFDWADTSLDFQPESQYAVVFILCFCSSLHMKELLLLLIISFPVHYTSFLCVAISHMNGCRKYSWSTVPHTRGQCCRNELSVCSVWVSATRTRATRAVIPEPESCLFWHLADVQSLSMLSIKKRTFSHRFQETPL